MNKTIVMLKCEDLSGLGGPMGTETTKVLWTKPFSSIEKAKKYATDWISEKQGYLLKIVWYEHSNGTLGCDCRTHGFEIYTAVMDGK